MGRTAHGIQLFYQFLERQFLMRIRIQSRATHLIDYVSKAGITRKIRAQHQRIHKKANEALELTALTTRDWRSHHQVLLARPAR